MKSFIQKQRDVRVISDFFNPPQCIIMPLFNIFIQDTHGLMINTELQLRSYICFVFVSQRSLLFS